MTPRNAEEQRAARQRASAAPALIDAARRTVRHLEEDPVGLNNCGECSVIYQTLISAILAAGVLP